jgi:hypothetical protein
MIVCISNRPLVQIPSRLVRDPENSESVFSLIGRCRTGKTLALRAVHVTPLAGLRVFIFPDAVGANEKDFSLRPQRLCGESERDQKTVL